jgi:hypothetical protein
VERGIPNKTLYNFIYENRDSFNLSAKMYSKPFALCDAKEIWKNFLREPPECKSHCCTGKFLSEEHPNFFRSISDEYEKFQWLFQDCKSYPESAALVTTEDVYWDVELQGDVRFLKASQGSSCDRYWRWKQVAALHVLPTSGPRHPRLFRIISQLTLCICHLTQIIILLKKLSEQT